MKRKYENFLYDIIENIEIIRSFTEGINFEEFKSDIKTVYSVTRALEIIGEASGQIPIDIKNKYPQIFWKEIKGLRDKAIHKYWGVDLEIEWDVIVNQLDLLEKQIREIIEKEVELDESRFT